ncbi:MAG TPA: alpha/beta hydrolase [Xanthobacteraceae bacterium]|nr:alpha/beta hydrolase [Xanthobacteraceae bacterium]
MIRNAVCRGALAVVLCTTAALAQSPAQLADIAAKVRALGPVIDVENTARLYARFHDKEPYAGVQVLRDLKYGADERQRLDLFAPAQLPPGPLPVLVFLDGAFDGDKHARTPFYDNVALWAARHGMIGVNADRRRAPAHPWPAGAEDVGAVVSWVEQNVAPYGGDPARVFLVGHSAGATHAASYLSHPEFYGPYGLGLAGVVLVSGLYDLTAMQPGPAEKAYFGNDPALYSERSALPGIVKPGVPILLVRAELDPPAFVQQAAALQAALCKDGRCPRFLLVPKHAHMSEVYAVNTTDRSLSGPLLDFIRQIN